jgi:hypothetical protein
MTSLIFESILTKSRCMQTISNTLRIEKSAAQSRASKRSSKGVNPATDWSTDDDDLEYGLSKPYIFFMHVRSGGSRSTPEVASVQSGVNELSVLTHSINSTAFN